MEGNVDKLFGLISLSHSGKLDTTKKISTGKPAPTSAGMLHRSQDRKYEAQGDATSGETAGSLWPSRRPAFGSRCYQS